jgi:DNA invertase Pin-like site-specific DNA recombinase
MRISLQDKNRRHIRWPKRTASRSLGLIAARARGRRGGRRVKLKPKEIAIVRKLYEEKQMPVEDICRMFKISRMTLWRYVKAPPSNT